MNEEYRAWLRAKYTDDELADMLKDGKAFANPDGEPSYPIADEEDLKKAIKAVGRGNADHDDIRKYIIGRAKDLDLEDLIPDNWNTDGSLSDEQENSARHPGWSSRSDGLTYNDTQTLVESAIEESLPASMIDPYGYVYVVDMTDTWAVYRVNWDGPLYQVDYSIDGDNVVTLGEPVEVAQITTYEAIPERSAPPPAPPKAPAVPKRGLSTLRWSPWEWSVPAAARTQVRLADDEPLTADFLGYASATEVAYSVTDWLGAYEETMRAGCYAKTLRETENIPLLFNHDGMPIASTGAATSRLSEDGEGLRNEADLDRRQGLTNDLCIALERGDLSKMSFSFSAVQQSWSDDYTERSVEECRLYDTSIVTYPANPMTSAALRMEVVEVIGREGRGLARDLRSAVVEARSAGRLAEASAPLADGTLAALRAADEFLVARHGFVARARTLQVAGLLAEAREGKVLSAANQKLLNDALEALQDADDAVDKANTAVAAVTGAATGNDDEDDDTTSSSNGDGASTSGPADGNPISPNDGAGPRSAAVEQQERELELIRLRQRRSRGR